MTFIREIETTSVTLVNGKADGSLEPAVRLELRRNNQNPQANARLGIAFSGSFPAEIEVEPGPECNPRGNIVSQIMLWGPRTGGDGSHRKRLSLSVVADNDGGVAGILDSTTNDPSNSAGQSLSMPLVLNAGEGKGLYLIFHPSDNTIGVQDRAAGVAWRGTASDFIGVLRGDIGDQLRQYIDERVAERVQQILAAPK